MFIHVFIYRFKCLIRDRQMVFWTLLFPLLLATFFYMAFINLNSDETFRPIHAGVISNAAYQQDQSFRSVLTDVSKGEDRLFNLKVASSKEKADQWLKSNRIQGYYFISGKELHLTVKGSGMDQSIMKSFADQYRHDHIAVEDILQTNPLALNHGLMADVSNHQSFVKETSGGSAEPNNILNYFYSLIAMACLYGSFWGMKEIIDIQADLSDRAARINVAPIHKLNAFLAGSCAALVILFTEILILLAYLHFGLKINFGNRAGYVLLTAFIGSVLGLSFGAFVSAAVKKGEGVKTAILMAVSMGGSFLSGMMVMNMKYLVAEYVPLLAWINPVNLLTDAFYSLYYYDSLQRYALNMGMMCAFIVLFCAGTYQIVRRWNYASL
ncbi:ABC transporter permease [Sporolactobacillus kofuensis]|uniref:ABC transporter permease n=1 Tax=Sporolactobacillus kofuensis TaxID=269672 RepID=A0ABW1WIZ6_9BACL|nr:ABC transporter permease [Sporolactobacillus kofuensis]MCO7177126.1 ABC transporter permease [Sporolactobacillus kofuensis]